MYRKNNNKFDVLASKMTRWIGSGQSIVIHTIFFALCIIIGFFLGEFDHALLFLTTIVSLEAIYLAILIQITVNQNSENLAAVGKDIDEIQEDIDEIQEDVDEIQEDIDEIQEDVDEIEEGDTKEEKRDKEIKATVESIQKGLEQLMKEFENLKNKS
jgi:low affinity Fe/Cu permease